MCCREWHNYACTDLDDDSYLFTSSRFRFGFRESYDQYVNDVDCLMAYGRVSDQAEGQLKAVTLLDCVKIRSVTGRLDDLPKKIKTSEEVPNEIIQNSNTFAAIVIGAI